MADQSFTSRNNNTNDTFVGVMLGGAIVVVLLLALVLNYFNFFPLSQSYPSVFGWLPHYTKTASVVTTPKSRVPQDNSFTPSLDASSQKGKLVKSATVVYTLEGKITKITPNGTNYNLEITSLDGSQIYNAINLGGENILRGSKSGGPIQWSELGAGDDVLVNLSVSSDASGKEIVSVGQILVNNR